MLVRLLCGQIARSETLVQEFLHYCWQFLLRASPQLFVAWLSSLWMELLSLSWQMLTTGLCCDVISQSGRSRTIVNAVAVCLLNASTAPARAREVTSMCQMFQNCDVHVPFVAGVPELRCARARPRNSSSILTTTFLSACPPGYHTPLRLLTSSAKHLLDLYNLSRLNADQLFVAGAQVAACAFCPLRPDAFWPPRRLGRTWRWPVRWASRAQWMTWIDTTRKQ